MKAKKLWDMELHEMILDEPWEITRVSGGWIYSTGVKQSTVFVPLNNELMEREQSVFETRFTHIGYRDGDGPVFQLRPGQSTEGFKKVFELVEDQP